MSRYGRCPCCNREFRSASSRELSLRRTAIIAELRDGIPAEHLKPLINFDIPKQVRHRQASEEYRRVGAP